MNFTQAAKPYVEEKFRDAQHAFTNQDEETGFKALEDAHVIGQHSTSVSYTHLTLPTSDLV